MIVLHRCELRASNRDSLYSKKDSVDGNDNHELSVQCVRENK